MIIFCYLLFFYFSTRGILLHYKLMPEFIDSGLNIILRGIFIVWFFIRIADRKFHKVVGLKITFFLLFLTLISSIINKVSGEQILRFTLNTFSPITIFYYVSYYIPSKRVSSLFKLITNYYLIQFFFSLVVNSNLIINGQIIVDDPFFGFYGYPRAYAFSYATTLISGILFFFYMKNKNSRLLLYIIPLFAVQVIAGAGTIILISLISFALVYFFFLVKERKIINLILASISIILFVPIITYYKNSMLNFDLATKDAMSLTFYQNPKVFYFLKSIDPLVNDPFNSLFGFGPGNYMSWTAKQFRTDLVRIFNIDLHNSLYTDAYQAFNNIVGFWGDIGFFGFMAYYLYLYNIYRTIAKKNTYLKFSSMFIVIFSTLLSTMQQPFDDVYYSFVFWIILGIILNLSNNNSSESKITKF